MKSIIQCHSILIICLFSSYTMRAQNKQTVLQDASRNTLKNKDSLLLKDTALLKRDTLEKTEITEDSTDESGPKRSHFQLSVTYQSNDVYLGRTDSTALPLFTPGISYIFKFGLEIDFSAGINVREPSPQVNSYNLGISYNFSMGNYSGSATLSGFRYSKNSGSPNAGKNGSLAYNSNYDLGFIEPSLNLTWVLASTPDYQASAAFQHEFDFLEKGNLGITPTATINASTQNVYSSYYQDRRYRISRPGNRSPTILSISGEVLNSGKFQIMDYEFSVPVNFNAGKWTFNFTPTYAMPVNPADILLTVKTFDNTVNKEVKETLPNVFYTQFGITYAF